MEDKKDKIPVGYVWVPYTIKTVSTSINGETVWYANKWKNILLENAITPIQQYAYTSGKNATDSAMFKQRYTTTKDLDRKDLYLWRWEVTEQRAKAAKQQIVSKFNVVF